MANRFAFCRMAGLAGHGVVVGPHRLLAHARPPTAYDAFWFNTGPALADDYVSAPIHTLRCRDALRRARLYAGAGETDLLRGAD